MATPATASNSNKSNSKKISDSTPNCCLTKKIDKKIPLLKIAKSPDKKPFKRTSSVPVNRQNGNLTKVPKGITFSAIDIDQDCPYPSINSRKNNNRPKKTSLLKPSSPENNNCPKRTSILKTSSPQNNIPPKRKSLLIASSPQNSINTKKASCDCPTISTPKEKSHAAPASRQNSSNTKRTSFTDDRSKGKPLLKSTSPQNNKPPKRTSLLKATSSQNSSNTKKASCDCPTISTPKEKSHSVPANRQNSSTTKRTSFTDDRPKDTPLLKPAKSQNNNPPKRTSLLKASSSQNSRKTKKMPCDCSTISTSKGKSHLAPASRQNSSSTKRTSFTDDRPKDTPLLKPVKSQNNNPPKRTSLVKASSSQNSRNTKDSSCDCPTISTPKKKSHSAPASHQNSSTTKDSSLWSPVDNTAKRTCLTALVVHQIFNISKGTPFSPSDTLQDCSETKETLTSVNSRNNKTLKKTISSAPVSPQKSSTTKGKNCSSSNESNKSVSIITHAGYPSVGRCKVIPCSMAMCPHCLKRICNEEGSLLEHFTSTHPGIGTIIIKRRTKYAMIMDHEFPLYSNTCITMMKMDMGPSVGLITLWLMLSRYQILDKNTCYHKCSIWMLTEYTNKLLNAKIHYAKEEKLVRVRTLEDMTSFKEIVKDDRCLNLSLSGVRTFLDRRGGTIIIQVI